VTYQESKGRTNGSAYHDARHGQSTYLTDVYVEVSMDARTLSADEDAKVQRRLSWSQKRNEEEKLEPERYVHKIFQKICRTDSVPLEWNCSKCMYYTLGVPIFISINNMPTYRHVH